MNKNPTNRTKKIILGTLAAGAALAFSGAALAANVPAWMARIQADACVATAGYQLSFDVCPHDRFHYGNVPLSVNAGTSDVSVTPSFTASNQGSESGCYDDTSCGRLMTSSSTGSFYHVGAFSCVKTRSGYTSSGPMGTGVVPRGGYAGIELRGYHSNGCGNRIKAIQY